MRPPVADLRGTDAPELLYDRSGAMYTGSPAGGENWTSRVPLAGLTTQFPLSELHPPEENGSAWMARLRATRPMRAARAARRSRRRRVSPQWVVWGED